MNIPTKEECEQILIRNHTPENIIEHCKTVAKIAEGVCETLLKKEISLNKELVIAAAMLHDIEKVKNDHVKVGADLIRSLGFPEVGDVMQKHSLYRFAEGIKPETIEEKIVFYSDKKAKGNMVVSVEERFEDLRKRYNVTHIEIEYNFTKDLEKELFGENEK